MSKAGFYAYYAGTRSIRIYTSKPRHLLDHYHQLEPWLFEEMFRVHLEQDDQLVFIHTGKPINVRWKR